jgi:hypothetical protein
LSFGAAFASFMRRFICGFVKCLHRQPHIG